MNSNELLIDTNRMVRVGGQLGSNPAGIFEESNGRRYYVKNLESEAHASNEFIAAKLYQLAGAPTLTYVHTQAKDQVATQWLALDKKHIAHFTETERKAAQQWLAVHAWTANWDAAGMDGDNQGVANGRVFTLDVGGALAFRAHGDPKGRAFGTVVDELTTLRNDPHNPYAVNLFADISDEALRESIQKVVCIPDEEIEQVILNAGGSAKLVEKMVARKGDMARRLGMNF
ncbi:hypothetical protein [Halioxenophilus sp. WMMB6]|uniref:hypothetical protein n=1 Tax=Halioxenophilus sp. WMMB6 TaxID=3073815 RepID=UPI00295F2D76|nr:hypothetical protein [Halioxenophilus sp. WMMB6]